MRISNFFKSIIQPDFLRYYISVLHIAILAVIAFIYYGSFYNYNFNWGDEGSVALISEKLYHGEKPYIDIEIGYGLFWYLPIVALFKLFGVKFYLIRFYFLGIGFLSSLLAYSLLLRLTANRRVAFLAGLVVLFFPGCIYQTYIPFLVLLGLYVLLLYDFNDLKPKINPWFALIANGFYFGCAFLIRGDIATVFTFIFLFYHSILLAQEKMKGDSSVSVIFVLAKRISIVSFISIIVALPFAIIASYQDYLDNFLHQYIAFGEHLFLKIQQRFFLDAQAGIASAGSLLPRPDLFSFRHVWWDVRTKIFLTYTPIMALFSIGLFFAVDYFTRNSNNSNKSQISSSRVYLLVVFLGAISAFPQFFVWRPDAAHLAGFFPGFVVLLTYFLYILSRMVHASKRLQLFNCYVFWVFAGFFAAYIAGFSIYYEDGPNFHETALVELKSGKGVDLFLPENKYEMLENITAVIQNESASGEYVLCFPYCPGIIFLADRPTFQKYLYVDDSFLITHPSWLEDMKAQIELKKPKVIIVNDWAINKTEISRFRNWAKPLYDYINQQYYINQQQERKTNFEKFEIFISR